MDPQDPLREALSAYEEMRHEAIATVQDEWRHGRVKAQAAEKIVDKLRAPSEALANPLTVSFTWTPVADGLPEETDVMLVLCEEGTVAATYHHHLGEWLYAGTAYDVPEVTHWAPLPPSPL